jgi:hypothetical protein
MQGVMLLVGLVNEKEREISKGNNPLSAAPPAKYHDTIK